MTKTIRSLALLTSCLALGACATEAPKDDKPKAQVIASARALPAPQEAPALTAAAPARPVSIADQPVVIQKADPIVAEFEHEDPEATVAEAEELPNFDRDVKAVEVQVDRFMLATGVDKREPTGVSDTFDTHTKRIFAFVQLKNEADPYSVEVHFEKVDGPKSLYGVKLQVPQAERYRTWAWTQIRRAPGEYRAVLRTPSGEEIASQTFTITEASQD